MNEAFITDLVDNYTAAIEQHLPPPAGIRGDLLDEIRDHIWEATKELHRTGVPPEEAARQAICAFGSPSQVGEELRAELLRRQAARSALGLIVGAPGLGLLWLSILLLGPHAPWTEPKEPVFLTLTDFIASVSMLLTFVGAVAASLLLLIPLRLRSSTRTIERARAWATRACTLAGRAFRINLGCILSYVALRGYLAPESLSWMAILLGVAASLFALRAVIEMDRSLRPSSGLTSAVHA